MDVFREAAPKIPVVNKRYARKDDSQEMKDKLTENTRQYLCRQARIYGAVCGAHGEGLERLKHVLHTVVWVDKHNNTVGIMLPQAHEMHCVSEA